MGRSIQSEPFSAQGLTNMQLVFFPQGSGAATEGYCSLYLKVQDGEKISRRLFVHRESRGPDIVRSGCEGYADHSPIGLPVASHHHDTDADVLVVGVEELVP